MKRLLSFALAMVMTLVLCPAASAAAQEAPVGWTVKELVPYGELEYISRVSTNLFMIGKRLDTGEKDEWGDPIYSTFFGFVDMTGKEVVPCKYEWVLDPYDSYAEGFAAVELDGKWGFVDETAREVIPCQYEEAGKFSEGFAAIKLNGKWGFIDKTAQEVIPCKYEEVGSFSEGFAAVKLNGKWGFVDKTGREVVPGKYVSVESFSEGIAVVAIDTGKPGVSLKTLYQYGFIDTTGKEVVPCKYAYAYSISNGVAAVAMDGEKMSAAAPLHNWGYVDKTGEEVVPCQYYSVSMPSIYGLRSDGFLEVETDSREVGLVDTSGKVIVPCGRYDSIGAFSDDGLARVEKGGKYGMIDTTGKEIISCQCDNLDFLSDGYRIISLNGAYGVIDATGRKVIPCQYEDMHAFSEDLVSVSANGKYGVIDVTGKEVIPFQYDWMGYIDGEQDWARVKKNGVISYIDKTGKEILSLEGEYLLGDWFEEYAGFHGGLACVAKETAEGGWNFGLIDGDGQEVLPPAYRWVDYYYTYDYNDATQSYIYGTQYLVDVGGVGPVSQIYGLYSLTKHFTGTIGQANELAWQIKDGMLTVTGPLGAEDMVAAACRDAAGRFIGAAVIRAGKTSAQLPKGTAKVKLMWLGAGLAPKCPCVEVGPAR